VTSWRVPAARGPIDSVFSVPASKSYHQRALVLSALSDVPAAPDAGGEPPGEDVRVLSAALERIGPWTDGALGRTRERLTLDLARNATGFRCAVACATLRPEGARTLVRGHVSLLARPHVPLVRALSRLGGHVRRRRSGSVRVRGGGLHGGEVVVPASSSSQYATALLLVAPRAGGVVVRMRETPVSLPYLRLTLEVLSHFGVACEAERLGAPGGVIRVPATAPRASRRRVPPDASCAAAWWAAAAVTAGRACVPGLGRGDAQADVALLGVLERMGARVEDRPDGSALVVGPGELLAPGDVSLRDAPDLLPLVAVLAARARGVTRIREAAHARVKESDRPAATARALAALGADVSVEPDGLVVRGGRVLRGAEVSSAGDHRIVFAMGVLGLVVPGVTVRGAEAVEKSHPRFAEDLARAAGAHPR
jgi:3-phosphoshikimate 1-carboxyvinyltransferase